MYQMYEFQGFSGWRLNTEQTISLNKMYRKELADLCEKSNEFSYTKTEAERRLWQIGDLLNECLSNYGIGRIMVY